MAYVKRKCEFCGRVFMADTRNIKRGWGRCCSKSCAASLRERNKPGYNPERVSKNNIRRENWTPNSKPARTKGLSTEEQIMEDMNAADDLYPDFDNTEI